LQNYRGLNHRHEFYKILQHYETQVEMKSALLQLISSQQLVARLYTFYELCGTVGLSRKDELLLLRLFHSLWPERLKL